LKHSFIIPAQVGAPARCGNATIYAMEMKSRYQLEHPDVNQAEWKAEIIIVEE
jgi:hypothetical protein